MSPRRLLPLLLLSLFTLAACQKEEDKPKPRSGPKVVVKEDGLTYEEGKDKPFTGTVRQYQKDTGLLLRETPYADGKKEGYARRWFPENPKQISQEQLWVRGDPVFEWRWWPNGQLKELSSQRDGQKDFGRPDIAHGSYVKWFADGKVQFKAHYDVNFFWHGHVLDYNDAGVLQWDAMFKHGVYQSGYRPPEAEAAAQGKPTPAPAPAPAEPEK